MASSLPSLTDKALNAVNIQDDTVDEKKFESSHASATDGSFVEGSEGVTHEELAILRHVPDSIPFAAFLVVIVELAERWTYYGGFVLRLGLSVVNSNLRDSRCPSCSDDRCVGKLRPCWASPWFDHRCRPRRP